jgi:hypothetical protein
MAAVAALSDVAPDRCIGEPDKFALEEIRRGVAATGLNGAHGPAATRIALTLESPPRHRLKTTAHRNLASSRDRGHCQGEEESCGSGIRTKPKR